MRWLGCLWLRGRVWVLFCRVLGWVLVIGLLLRFGFWLLCSLVLSLSWRGGCMLRLCLGVCRWVLRVGCWWLVGGVLGWLVGWLGRGVWFRISRFLVRRGLRGWLLLSMWMRWPAMLVC